MIQFENTSRWYGQVIGLNDITATIPTGITALLGQNGAGKSTMMRLVTGQLRPTTGRVLVKGLEPFANPEVFRVLGYCPEIDNFYETMTGRQFVWHMARLHGYGPAEARKRTDESIDRVGMSDRADKALLGFSKGMRQRIKLAQAMLHDPDIILLDEPLNGLDPVGRREFMDVLAGLAAEGKTIVVSSHILFEVEQMTRNILLLHRGRLLASGDLGAIRELIDKYPHRIHIDTSDPRRVGAVLAALPYIVNIEYDPDGKSVEIKTREPDRFYTAFAELVLEHRLPIIGFVSPDNNLESVYQYLVEA
jgi:ABC-2 type transport system ATP-binding protein